MAGFPRPKQRRAEAARRRCLMQAAAAAGAVLFLYLLVSLGRTASSPGGGPSEQALASPVPRSMAPPMADASSGEVPAAGAGSAPSPGGAQKAADPLPADDQSAVNTTEAQGSTPAGDAAASAASGGALRPYCGHMRSASDLAGVGAAEGIEACIHDRGPAPPLGILSETASGKWACLPSFVIMGAGKSGTTTLAAALDDHPQVHSLRQAYSARFFTASDAWERMEEYANENMRLSELSEGEQNLVFEKTAFYYSKLTAACNVRMLLPQSKIVYAVRDPVNRTMSQYGMNHIRRLTGKLEEYQGQLGKGEAKLTLEEASEAMAELAEEQRAACDHFRSWEPDQAWNSQEIADSFETKDLIDVWELMNHSFLADDTMKSLYWAHLYRWVKAGHRAEDMCILVLEHVESDYTRAMTELFTCLGLDVPDEEWMAAHDYTEFKKNEGRMEQNPEEVFSFPEGSRARHFDEVMEGTARDMYDIAYPVLAESRECFREALREKAPLMFGDDARRLQELVPPSVDLQALWGLP